MGASSPTITDLAWGRVVVEGHGELEDAKLWPGGARAWDWRETGTQHSPGVQPADVAELVEHGADVVVLSRGVDLVLEVPQETVAWLEGRGVEVHVEPSVEAVRVYRRLARAGRAVGLLLHTTC